MKPSWWRRLRCDVRRSAKKHRVRTQCTDCIGCSIMYLVAADVLATVYGVHDSDIPADEYTNSYGKVIVKLHKEFGI